MKGWQEMPKDTNWGCRLEMGTVKDEKETQGGVQIANVCQGQVETFKYG